MANRQQASILLLFSLLLTFNLIVTTFGKLECEDLPIEDCAFSVASSGTRCVLENYKAKDGSIQYECQSSIVLAEKQEEWIESDECINACGLERMSVGLSTDLLLDSHFADMFCSSECLNNCPNLIDLYINLAAGEGMYLPQLCKTHRTRRVIADPVKKATDAEYLRSLLPTLTSSDAMAPGASPIPGVGGSWLPQGPDYRGYGGSTPGPTLGATPAGEELPEAPTATPTAGNDTVPPPPSSLEQAPAIPRTVPQDPSNSKRPFFFLPPTPSATSTQSGTPSEVEPGASSTESATAPSLDPDSDLDDSWQSGLTKLPDSHRLNEDDQILYETYFH